MHDQTTTLSPRKQQGAMLLLRDIRTMLDDIAQSATILGATPFAGRQAARSLADALHSMLLEYEISLAELGLHAFDVKQTG
jgi:hypothetical protein